jgi:hypothetical protein
MPYSRNADSGTSSGMYRKFMADMAAVLDVIRGNVEDEPTRRRMGRELRAIDEGNPTGSLESGSVVGLREARSS